MKKYLIHTALFLGLSLFFFIPPLSLLMVTREIFTDLDPVIQSNEPYLIGFGMKEENYKFLKWQSLLKQNRKEVLVLGSSRVLQFRSEMFTTSFYNAGFTIKKMRDFLPFLTHLPEEKYPKILLIGLDQWMFNPETNKIHSHYFQKPIWESTVSYLPSMHNLSKSWKYLIEERQLLLQRHHKHFTRIGINATVYNTGFRNDGSKYYGYQIYHLLHQNQEVYDYQFSDTFKRIDKGKMNFEYAFKLDLNAYNDLYMLLSFCQQHEIKVVGILPPFAKVVNQKMCISGNYQYIDKIYPQIQPLFQQFNFECYDFKDMSNFGATDTEVLDGFHGGEKMYLRLLIQMLQQKSILNQVCNKNRLEKDLENAVNPLKVYPN